MEGDRMLDASAVAKRIGAEVSKVYVLIQAGDLAAINIATSGSKRATWRIPESSLLDFMSRRSTGTPIGMQTR